MKPILFFIAILISLSFAISNDNPKYDYYYNKSKEYLKNSNFPAAIMLIDSAIAVAPERDSSYTVKGNAFYLLYRPSKAIEQLDKAIALNSKNHYAHYIKGMAISITNLTTNTLFTDSIIAITQKHKGDLEWKRKHIYNRYYVPDGNYGMYDYKTAIDYVTKAIQLSSVSYYFYYSTRAYLYAKLRQNDSAMADYERALELSPHTAWLYLEKGKLYEKLAEYDKVNYHYTKGIKADSTLAELYELRGRLYQNIWQDKEYACKDFRKATMLGRFIEDMDDYCKITWYDTTFRMYDVNGRLHSYRHDYKSSCFCPKFDPATDTLIEEIDEFGFKRTTLDTKPSQKTTWQFDDGKTIEISKKTKERWLKEEEEKRKKKPIP